MTVIVYRDGIMAADTSRWTGEVWSGGPSKIYRFGSRIIGCGGTSGAIAAVLNVLEWDGDRPYLLREDKLQIAEGDFAALAVGATGVFRMDSFLEAFPVTVPFVAIGACMEFVYGALYAGASAEEAVRLAINYTGAAGGEVDVVRV